MADFFNEKPQNTYKSILNIGTENNQTIDTTLRTIEDGRGNETALKVSSSTIGIGDITIANDNTIQGVVLDGGTF